MPKLTVTATIETWPIAGEFTISRGAKREATVVVARVSDGQVAGRGECVPYARYGETVTGVRDAILALGGALADRDNLTRQMPAGAARNALDCALWDYEAKRSGQTVARLAGLCALGPVTTAYTISLGSADAMAGKAADAARTMPLLKLKLGGDGDAERLRQVRAACSAYPATPNASARYALHAHGRASSPMPTRPGRRRCFHRSWPLLPRPASS
jgi:L-alanine-DL-glutamate epimerase-like enolase superfamily enzyme